MPEVQLSLTKAEIRDFWKEIWRILKAKGVLKDKIWAMAGPKGTQLRHATSRLDTVGLHLPLTRGKSLSPPQPEQLPQCLPHLTLTLTMCMVPCVCECKEERIRTNTSIQVEFYSKYINRPLPCAVILPQASFTSQISHCSLSLFKTER